MNSTYTNDILKVSMKLSQGIVNVVAKQTASFNRSEGLTVMEKILQYKPNVTEVIPVILEPKKGYYNTLVITS